MKTGNRRQTIMFVVLGVLVVVFLGQKVMNSGGGGGNDGATEPPTVTTLALSATPPAGADAQTPDATTPGVELGPDDTFSVFATRNPFEPVTGGGSRATTPDDDSPAGTNSPIDSPPSTGAGTAAVGSFDPTRQTSP